MVTVAVADLVEFAWEIAVTETDAGLGTVEGAKVTDYKVFVEGFLDVASDKAWGRPVDALVMPDGALLVSDDEANAIYRISYRK